MAQRILITGASGVIGAAVARALAGPGSAIVVHHLRNQEKADGLKRDLEKAGAAAHALSADLALAGGPGKLIEEAHEFLGGLDLLVHCAAAFDRTPFAETTAQGFDRIMAVDLKAAFFLAQGAAAAMGGTGGSMVFISDIAAVKPYAAYLPYCIAKAGVDCLVRGLARSLAPGIRVNAVAPYIVTRPKGMTDEGWNDLLTKTPMRRASEPEEIADVVRMLALAGGTITGQVIAVDGGRML